MQFSKLWTPVFAGSLFFITSCSNDDPNQQLKEQVIGNYVQVVYAGYDDAYQEAVLLKNAIDAFVQAPSAQGLENAKQAWLNAREPYGQTEAFRFYGGPIDDEDGPEGLLNAWPLDEAYIDYVVGNPNSGIINDPATYPQITADLLSGLNENGGEANISIGYHAIEFLLWGQDLSSSGPGNRDYTDYTTLANADRRKAYLKICAELLVEHLAELRDAWNPAQTGNYASQFKSLPVDEALQKIFTGIGVLSKSELAGERIYTALDNQDQEDEHSCFSDNTHRDIITNFQGIRNVYMGSYTRVNGSIVSGTSLADLVGEVNATLNQKILSQLELCHTHTQAIHNPFDQAIILPNERPKVLETVTSLQALGDYFAEAGTALNLSINTNLPE